MKAIPPMSELFNMAGLELPDFLAKKAAEREADEAERAVKSDSVTEVTPEPEAHTEA